MVLGKGHIHELVRAARARFDLVGPDLQFAIGLGETNRTVRLPVGGIHCRQGL